MAVEDVFQRAAMYHACQSSGYCWYLLGTPIECIDRVPLLSLSQHQWGQRLDLVYCYTPEHIVEFNKIAFMTTKSTDAVDNGPFPMLDTCDVSPCTHP